MSTSKYTWGSNKYSICVLDLQLPLRVVKNTS